MWFRKNLETGTTMPCDQGGFIYEKDEIVELFESVMEFYNIYGDEYVRQHNDKVYDRHFGRNREKVEVKRKPKKGYVYFIKAENGLTKIGETKDLKTRVKSVQQQIPMESRFLFAVKTDDTVALEEMVHTVCDRSREKGEWFSLSEKNTEGLLKWFKEEKYEIVYEL